jgi:flagellar operon protein
MTDKIAFVPTRLTPAELEARKQTPARPSVKGEGSAGGTFADALKGAEQAPAQVASATGASLPGSELRFSAHAEARLRRRDIRLTPADTARISQAVEVARAKGAQESLILFDDLALIVSIRNKLVITALEGGSQANVFTHIDSAVVLPGPRS